MNIDNLEDLCDDMEECQEDVDMGAMFGGAADDYDDELEAELNQLEAEDLGAEMMDAGLPNYNVGCNMAPAAT